MLCSTIKIQSYKIRKLWPSSIRLSSERRFQINFAKSTTLHGLQAFFSMYRYNCEACRTRIEEQWLPMGLFTYERWTVRAILFSQLKTSFIFMKGILPLDDLRPTPLTVRTSEGPGIQIIAPPYNCS
jgi:hypothetical protein